MADTTIADRLRWARTAANVPSRALDRAADLKSGHVSMIESRGSTNLDTETATKLAHALGVSLDWLVNGVGKPPTEKSLRTLGDSMRDTG